MTMPHAERLRSINSFPQLVKYLRDELDWPIERDEFEDLTFDYEPDDLGLDPKAAVYLISASDAYPARTGSQFPAARPRER